MTNLVRPVCRSRSRRGSALIFAVVLISAITIYFVAAQELMMATVRTQQRFENRTKARLATESAAAYAVSLFRDGLLTLPDTRSVPVAGISVTTTTIDNSGLVPRTMQVSTTLTLKDQVFSDSMVVGQRVPANQWNYAVFVNSSISWSDVLTTGSAGSLGDFYKGTSTVGGGYTHTINGDFECGGSVSNFVVSGTLWTQCPTITFTLPLINDYLTALDTNYVPGSMDGFTFTDFGPTRAHLVYKSGDLDIKGDFTGNGVIFATGQIDINDDITVTGGKLVIISDGTLRLKKDNAVVQAFLFCENATTVQNAGMTVTGCLLTSTLTLSKNVTVIYDPYFWNNPTERARFRLPGHWP